MRPSTKSAKAAAAPGPAPKPAAGAQELPPPARRFLPPPQTLFPPLAFLLVFYLCLWKWVDVGLIYHGGGQVKDFPSFYWGWEFARDFKTHPGGLAEYGSAFLAQSLCFSWFGALVLTVQAGVVYACLAGCFKAFGAASLRFLGLLPALLILVIYSKYRLYSAPVMSFTVAAMLLWAWLRVSAARPHWRLASALVLVGLAFAAAPTVLIVFVPVVALLEFRSRTPWWKLLPWLAAACFVPWLEGAALFGFAPGEAYAKLLPLALDSVAWSSTAASLLAALFSLAPLCCGLACLWELARPRQRAESPAAVSSGAATGPAAAKAAPKPAGSPPAKRKDLRPAKERKAAAAAPGRWWKWQTAGLAIAPVIAVYVALNPLVRAFLVVDYLAWHQRWPEIASAAQANPRNAFVACAVAQASYHQGALTKALPFLPTPSDLLLFNDKQQSHWKKSDLYFDLGYVNMALHHLTESVEFYGERPILLRRLALVNLALGNVSTAKVYLGTLARAPFQGGWARDYLARLQTDPTLADDEEVDRLRRFLVKRDFVLALSVDEEMLLLLGANRQNRMAFEYLMTYYLMTKNLNAFVKNLPRVKDFAGFEISPLWDEALLLAARQSNPPVELSGHTVSSEARARVEMVTRVVQQYTDKRELARRELSAAYADSYSYYWYFHR